MSNAPVVRLDELVHGIASEVIDVDRVAAVQGLETDSRKVEAGQVFVALRGDTVDGHAYVAAARQRGATLAIVDRQWAQQQAAAGASTGGPTVVVDNTRLVVGTLAHRAYASVTDSLALAGITGTNGKTTVAHLVASALAATGRLHLRFGTTGHWLVDHERPSAHTTPFPAELHQMAWLAHQAKATHGVMEVSSHALEQGRVDAVGFQAVALTSFSQDHLDYHATMESYLAAKCRLPARHLRPGAVAVALLESQAPAQAFLAAARRAGGKAIAVSSQGDPQATFAVTERDEQADGLHLSMRTPEGPLQFRSPLIGSFNVDNLVVAAAVLSGLGLQRHELEVGLSQARGAPGRLERVPGPRGAPSVFVDYAHTPDAVERVIAAVRPLTRGRVIVVLGCGGDRDRSKRAPMGELAARYADHLVATSDNPRTEDPERILNDMLTTVGRHNVTREVDRRRAIELAITQATGLDTILLLGKGHETYQIVGRDRLPFDDRAVADAVLQLR